jgi:transposase-like protein/IS1 family transposase
MIFPSCEHTEKIKYGRDRYGNQRYRCTLCGKISVDEQEAQANRKPKPLGKMVVPVEKAKLVLQLLLEGSSIRSTERVTKVHRDTICKLIVHFGDACRKFLQKRMRNLTLNHLEFDEQWTYVYKKQNRLTLNERETVCDKGDVYLWTAIDKTTKLMPSFLIGKRSADNARKFMVDVASRLTPLNTNPHASDDHAFRIGVYPTLTQISTDGFPGYPEAVDLAFGPYVKFGTIQKEYRNAKMTYTPSEIVGTKRNGIQGINDGEKSTICTSHIERLNGTQRLFMKRLNRLTVCFSKKLRNLEAAFAMFSAWYNYCWRTRRPGKSGRKRPTAAMMAQLTDHVWSFDELFDTVLKQ